MPPVVMSVHRAVWLTAGGRQASGTFEQNNHVVINDEGADRAGSGPQALKAVYDVARKAAMDVVTGQMRDGRIFFRRWTMKTFAGK